MKAEINTFLDILLLHSMGQAKSDNSSNSDAETANDPPEINLLKTDLFTVQFLKKNSKKKKRLFRSLGFDSNNSSNKDNFNNENTNEKTNSEEISEEDKLAIENRLTIVNYKECEDYLKKINNITSEESLVIKQVEFDAQTDLLKINDSSASSGVTFEFYHPQTLDKLDASQCNDLNTGLKIPFKEAWRINMNLYQKTAYLSSVIDIYNKNSVGYYSRCVKTASNSTGADMSINYRRTVMFQNQTIQCSLGCSYKGLDENKYVKCECQTDGKNEISNNSTDEYLVSLPAMNYDIALCYKEAFFDVFYFLINLLLNFHSSFFSFRNRFSIIYIPYYKFLITIK